MINFDGDYWAEQIVVYCGEHHIKITKFAELSGIHYNTLRKILNGTTKKITPSTAGILYNVIFRNNY